MNVIEWSSEANIAKCIYDYTMRLEQVQIDNIHKQIIDGIVALHNYSSARADYDNF